MTENITRVEDMPVYQGFYELALLVESTTRDFRADFRWLRNQALRSSESVCANMTEGFYSQYSTEYLQCLYRCRREARETMMHFKYGNDVGLISESDLTKLSEQYEESLRELSLLIQSIERKIRFRGKGKPGTGKIVKEEREEYDVNHQPLTINHSP